jgi:hypothetical protein
MTSPHLPLEDAAVAPRSVTPEATVREVMAQWPWTVRVFERHGLPLQGVGLLDAAFWMLNAGCAIRVLFQAVAGFVGGPYTLISSSSAYLEIPAIACFSLVIWKTLDARVMTSPTTDVITLESRVGALIERRPELLAVFLRHGFAPLANPILRRTMGAVVSVQQACALHHVDAEALLRDLRAAAAAPRASGRRAIPLRVVS